MGKGITYSINQEKYLRRFLEDGDVPLDNNSAEQAIRGFVIGKRNWHLIDTIAGAETSAVCYSIAETAKANDLNPYRYFEYLLTEIASQKIISLWSILYVSLMKDSYMWATPAIFEDLIMSSLF